MESISVIMNSVGEHEPYFHEAVKSILKQRGVKVHLILSTVPDDNSIEWIKQHKGDVEVFLTPHDLLQGKNPVSSFTQLNRALSKIKSDWFIFASSNCVLQADKYRWEIQAANRVGGYVGYSNFIMTDEDLKIIRHAVFGKYDRAKHQRSNFIPDQSVINYKKLKHLLPFDTTHYNMGYWDFWLRVYRNYGNVFGYCDRFTRFYRRDSKQMSVSLMNPQEKIKRQKAQRYMLAKHK